MALKPPPVGLKKYPRLIEEWHKIKNGNLTPNDVSPSSKQKVWWRCAKGHEWPAAVRNRTRGYGCPYCSGNRVAKDTCLALKHPGLANEWHPTKNGNLTAHDVTPGSGNKVWWQCERGHEWPATINNRTSRRSGCPVCAGKMPSKDHNLAINFPEIAKEWHPTKNGELTPFDVTPGSERKVWWKGNCGHEWPASIKNRTSHHSRCPFCFGKGLSKSLGKDNNLAVRFPEIAKQWHPTRNGDLSAWAVSPGSTRKVWWQCERGHEWPAIILNRTRWPGCPACRRERHLNL